ncbi:cytochrome P450 [Aspergillus costaricaensis CBS 115574]|uniref:Cytochrome P450 n=1 Tax=Aspergillus costaricaensis CBS 115574 TaxID=1448317 RepID=A0ACD1IT06_9EURO|nr:cytochrome P450 [Aspergillus costaricaensis CBS 115574]RAK93773.1 cytochrome P450 [Aspergillus costaricaensis CBS 115574]
MDAIHVAVVAFIVVLLMPILIYLRDVKGLRKYPAAGPFGIAALTPLWLMYHNWSGVRWKAIKNAHQQHGSIVRISPNHLSFTDPDAYKEIYGHKADIVKDVFYSNMAGNTPNMADATDRVDHARKRKHFAAIFSAKNVAMLEPRVQACVTKLVECLKIKAGGGMVAETDRFPVSLDGSFDIRPWLNMFTYDAISSMMWSESFGFLDRGDDSCVAEAADGATKTVHAMQTFQDSVWFSVFCAHLPPLAYEALRFLSSRSAWQLTIPLGQIARYKTNKRLGVLPEQQDIFAQFPTASDDGKGRHSLPMWELVAESSVMLNAGNDTTQTTLTNNLLLLSLHPEIQSKLRAILISAIPASSRPVASYSTLSQISYLRAVIDESFRILTPQRFGLPRRTVSPSTIAGHVIPPAVTVSSPLSELHVNPALFSKPREWIPERWLADSEGFGGASERANLKEYVMPFTTGARACIGRNLAYMEVSIALAALVMQFEWMLGEGGPEECFGQFERITSNPTKLVVRVRPVEA